VISDFRIQISDLKPGIWNLELGTWNLNLAIFEERFIFHGKILLECISL
jgi:hypothetical protein